MTQRQRRLGRGLGALLPTGTTDESMAELDVRHVGLDLIHPNRYQPRLEMDETALEELTDSVRTHGVLEPIIVRPDGAGYELVVGERRWRAAGRAGLEEIPAVVRDLTDEETAVIALVENLQREDLNPIEEARAYKRLLDLNLTQEEVAVQVGRSRSAVANSLRLLMLDEETQRLIARKQLSVGHAKVLLSVEAGSVRNQLQDRVLAEDLTVRQTEALVRDARRPSVRGRRRKPAVEAAKVRRPDAVDTAWADVEERLSLSLGTKVRIVSQGDGGRIIIDFFDTEDANRILDLIVPRGT